MGSDKRRCSTYRCGVGAGRSWLLALWFVVACLGWSPQGAQAQFRTDQLITMGRSALYYEDYVLSIQYFNQAISSKPYLYEPWFFRGVAKYYLDDYAGAESDCTAALKRNPYVVGIYELRGLTRIQQKKFAAAVDDYSRALKYEPMNQGLWHNRVLCHISDSNYTVALAELDTMLTRWSRYAKGYVMQAEVYMLQKDTTQAIKSLEKSLDIDPYDGNTWAVRSVISLSRQKWKEGEKQLDKAIHLLPKNAGNYINRALARYNQNNLRGAMADYDTALDLDPNNFLGHYNRGLLRAQVGDDNRGIEDFDFVLRLEPDNLMALFNRGLLRDQTGNVRGAIEDYSKVIAEYPNFWTGLQFRARCYRRLGMTRQAEADEFRILKAQMDKRYGGKQPRLNKRQMRKRSDDDPEKYNQLVVADEDGVEHEYTNSYRGRVQNRKADMAYMPMYALTLEQPHSELKNTQPYDRQVEDFNQQAGEHPLYVNAGAESLTEEESKFYFAYLDTLSRRIDVSTDLKAVGRMLLLKAVAYSAIQNFERAIDDLGTVIQIDSTQVLAYWQRAVCQSKINDFQSSQGTNVDMKRANVLSDLTDAIRLNPQNAYLYYNRGNIHVQRQDYGRAIEDYSRAIDLDPNLAEAYYNRGLVRIHTSPGSEGIADLSKAGELGLYTAYSVIKQQQR